MVKKPQSRLLRTIPMPLFNTGRGIRISLSFLTNQVKNRIVNIDKINVFKKKLFLELNSFKKNEEDDCYYFIDRKHQ